ncbi:signal transducer and activator of transcription 1-alpha/beta-like isoform X2 [Callorhinchus milii]|uniref:Signal transducer and activator of transcription n=2 Tax=Callorhinchus milii TaxID=7868 RepID=A0A4W3I9P3_CALMI|nr:signal transducer and activator of transcription 1-alpha/beta-like isoform X2 [Callorhinchus milii]XP_042200177.1 signal transducer and activator of transcription 1-alpha/beta-like isoform X2 [Callorhinchus milii]XP_042200178.1 signal transducer and activator of transcription 1-alpha/beta-like isoform X2 [Callorhinchus milii]XP_042200179.1 signal transducer and activator of transcription 1-alpha/beta-like isoform X2 [Callorhinchus milii]|eukprot:gi/632986374/ref/XP_007910202.1/ PREDICTED: signal transducer and activator of transcription 1-alpha/beta-like [Callorhinchus milii]
MMSQWELLKQLDTKYLEQLDELYQNEALPMDIREYLAHWIEAQHWEQAATSYSQATILYQNLLEQINNQYSRFMQEKAFVSQHNFKKYRQNIQAVYGEDPVQLAKYVAAYLKEEGKILAKVVVDQQAPVGKNQPMESEKQQDIEQKMMHLKSSAQMCEQESTFLEEQQDEFDFKFKTHQVRRQETSNYNDAQLTEDWKTLQIMLNKLDSSRNSFIDKFSELLTKAEKLLDILVSEELVDWKIRQQKACIGAPITVSLDQLENWFTVEAECLFQLKRLLKKLEELGKKVTYENDPFKTKIPALKERTIKLLSSLIKSAFVVENQPCMAPQTKMPLLLKTSTQFTVKPRLLVKLPELNHLMKVRACIDKNPPNGKGYRRFNILGTISKAMNMDELRHGGLCADFRHLQLKEQKSGIGGKGSNEVSLIVTEELHIISFETELHWQELVVKLETSTLPVVVISNASQLLSGWASVLWYNMLCNDPKHLLFFSNTPAAPWHQLSDALSWQFESNTKRGLDSDQLSMLAEKLFGPQQNYADSSISWARFCKENLPKQNFSFWIWLQGILELIKRYLEDIWNAGHIIGFLSKQREKILLKTKPTGTFLLRFSESYRDGGITFSWVEHLPNGKPKIHSVEPYTKTHLSNISLSDIIHNYNMIADENVPEHPLLYLYPNIPKDEAFGHYYTNSEPGLMNHKYLKTKLIVVSERPPTAVPSTERLESLDMDLYDFPLSDSDLIQLLETSDLNQP